MKSIFLVFVLYIPLHVYASGIDVHAHADVTSSAALPSNLITEMDRKGIDTVILMTTPEGLSDESSYSSEDLINFFPASTYGTRIKFFYGGVELNPLLHGIGRQAAITDSNRWDAEGNENSVFPNGCSSGSCSTVHASGIAAAEAIEAEGASGATYSEFIRLARAAASSGLYLGFGEIGPLHYSQRSNHPYVSFTANHQWMKELSDIAASYNMVIDLHLEITDSSKIELEDLLSYNRNTKILLEHVGWSTNDTASASIFSTLMSANPNLYLVLKKCHEDGSDSCYIDSSNSIKSEWLILITTYSNRIMIGSDAKYWTSSATISETMNMAFRDRHHLGDRQGELKYLIEQLSVSHPSVSRDITENTARTLFGL